MKTLRNRIGKRSIHAQMIDIYGQDKMNKIFREGKDQIDSGKNFFCSEMDKKLFVFLCMSDIEEDGAARVTIEQLKNSIDSLFLNQNYINVLERKMCFPILGTGAGGVCMEKEEIIKLIIRHFVNFQKGLSSTSTQKIDELNIVVGWKDIGKIDWEELKEWSILFCEYCIECERY